MPNSTAPLGGTLVMTAPAFRLQSSGFSLAQWIGLELTVRRIGASYAAEVMLAGRVLASDASSVGAHYVDAVVATLGLPLDVATSVRQRWARLPTGICGEDVRIKWFVAGFCAGYSARRAATTPSS